MTEVIATTPAWARDVDLSIPLHPQILLTGNVRDLYPTDGGHIRLKDGELHTKIRLLDLVAMLWHVCEARGYAELAVWDGMTSKLTLQSGLDRNIPKNPDDPMSALSGDFKSAEDLSDLERLGDLMIKLQKNEGPAIGLVIQYAARLASANLTPQPDARKLLARAEVLGHNASSTHGTGMMPFNTIFWVCSRQEELHSSFVVDSPALRVIRVPFPTREVRTRAARSLFSAQIQNDSNSAIERASRANALAEVTHGMTVRDLRACLRLANDRGLAADSYADSARLLQIGTHDDHWSATALRGKIEKAEEYLNARVLGQERAVNKAVDILIRSAAGLNGAHMSSSPNRPRGVLFLAGPTGVGKTELAKGIASLILGEGADPVRFDMSEFRADEARQRLIGAPPGYVGYDVGGELTNAVRANPVCVLLFDEIEKAHPRIFDLFLQILEDGRLTDGRGATVYFTECFLVFTSNLGTVERTVDRRTIPAEITRNTEPGDVEPALRKAFDDFFNIELGRPEIRNRFGDSFVALDYIDPKIAPKILGKALDAVASRVMKVHGLHIIFDDILPDVEAKVIQNLPDGGRGIGTVVESLVVNPLAREIFFDATLVPGATIRLTNLKEETAGRWTLKVQRCPE
jgi:hypothetical protein